MEVDSEERKVDVGEYDGVDDDSDEMESTDGGEQSDEEQDEDESKEKTVGRPTSVVENPFLDSFYSLSAPNPKERSQAAQVMLHHCLLGPESNSKDAAYAFRRLLNGLCSGRAAARQGNASALASFLKIAFQLEKMDEIRIEAQKGEENTSSLLSYVRDRLISATDAQRTEGKKKGSEERDYHFGRLFGILGVVRSRILLLPGNDDEIREVASTLVLDLVELFWYKRWMREPAAHGITAMLNLFFESGSKTNKKIGWHLVQEVVIPKVLSVVQGSEENDFQTILEKSCAEQIGIGAYIQSQPEAKNLPFPLDKPILSTETIPWIGQALSETSVIVQPRTHFVWDALWCYLTEKEDKQGSKKNPASSSKYIARNTVPLGEDRVIDVIEAIMKVVVEEKLLRLEKDSSVAKATHERKALALCIVRNLSGAPFVSSISGPIQVSVPSDAIENIILTKDIVKLLFLDVIGAGKKKKDASHLLKPLALKVLEAWVQSTIQSGDTVRQLSCVKAITNCHPRFDSLTKTKTLSELVMPSNSKMETAAQYQFLGKYLDYLETKFLELCHSATSTEALGYVELMYTSAKQILHKNSEGEKDGDAATFEYKKLATKRVLGFFMSTAFFDCSTLKKKKKGETKGVSESAFKVQAGLQDGQKIAYPIRVMISSRFYALASDFVTTISHESTADDNAKLEKDSNAFVLLEEICDDWTQLESNNATRFIPAENEEEDDDDDTPEHVISYLRDKVAQLKGGATSDDEARKRCITGISVLSMTLHLHRLSCGSDDENNEMDDNPDADEEEDEENICSAIADLKSISSDFFQNKQSDSNPLLGLAEVCTNILSSPLGSGDIGRGAAPKLVREAIKYAWLGGLKLASTMATKEKTLLDDAVVGLLLDAIGAADANEDVPDDDAEMSDDEDEDDSEGESDDDDLVFSKASKVLDDSDDMEEDEKDASDMEDDEESDIELDPSKVHTMLEDDNLDDIDDIPLEHHEGADAALAKLIKMKQEARKAGQEAREKIEMANQLRCTLLIDLLLGRPDSWNKLFQSSIILKMVLPLLECQKRIGISTQRASEGKTGTAEKKALLHRITSLIKQKLSKVRRSSMPLSSPIDMGTAKLSFQSIMKEAKNAKDKEYLSCCSSSLVFLLRMMPKSPELVLFVSSEYGTLVSDWSTKRNNGASLLEDVITQMPALAQASLASALSSATQEARGFFLKMEAYRLLSLLFANKPDTEGSSDMEKIALSKIHEKQDELLTNVNKTLSNEEDMKPKFAKAVFKTLEKMLPFVSTPLSSDARDLMTAIKIEISGLGDKQKELNTVAAKLAEQVDSRLEELNAASAKTVENKAKSPSGKKTKKKKKKKR